MEPEEGHDDDDNPNKPSYFSQLVYGLEDPSHRVSRLGTLQVALSFLQMALCGLVVVMGFVARGQGEAPFRTFFGAGVGLLSAVFGIHGAARRSETTTRLFFVFQMWGLSTTTMYLYVNVALERQQERLCYPSVADYGTRDTAKCEEGVHEQRGKLAISIIAALVGIATSMVALDFNDALNDLMAALASDPMNKAKVKANARAQRRVNFMTVTRGAAAQDSTRQSIQAQSWEELKEQRMAEQSPKAGKEKASWFASGLRKRKSDPTSGASPLSAGAPWPSPASPGASAGPWFPQPAAPPGSESPREA